MPPILQCFNVALVGLLLSLQVITQTSEVERCLKLCLQFQQTEQTRSTYSR